MRADARANRQALVDAAHRLYSSRGAPVPLSAVAQDAGVGIATLYRHFPTQQDLVLGLLQHVRDQILGICERWLPVMESDPRQGWSDFCWELARLQLGALLPQLMQGQDPQNLPPELIEIRVETLAAVDQVVTGARTAGLVRADVTTEHFHIGLGVLTRPLPPVVSITFPELSDWLIEVYLRGLRPTP